MKKIQDFGQFLNEKWNKDVKVKKTGEYADKTKDELEGMLDNLKAKSKKYQEKGEKVPKKIKEKESEIVFALRAKGGWKKGEGAISK